jgi:hypothetical protein
MFIDETRSIAGNPLDDGIDARITSAETDLRRMRASRGEAHAHFALEPA